ncbi:protein POOR HOMOLOGOUS SYNAPSIS 1 isoform X2 [Oryza brachyantha]|uniref:protein POOR HOMOLOGOUS SYNAPSIS 1 isoform X2 n=1 Tax=Oryza brachyantha TaxID=4533 RepID=UPI001ADAF694|nr:protein POOR HOMOLOGOUS SYNAPSIS 1 isoform X2 [Oryza brachyantha]
MVDANYSSGVLLPARATAAAAAAAPRRRQKWAVEFARYFRTPRRDPSNPPPPGLRLVSRGKLRHHGTWLPAASPATLAISLPSHSFAAPVLTVSIGNVVFEEHFVSILNFSWPQVTCVTQCPISGSRVVFVSFCDKSKEIHKFALRFPQLSDAESFLNCVKECSTNTMDIIPSGSDYLCEDSSASEYIASSGIHQRPHDTSSFEKPEQPTHRTKTPALHYHEEPDVPIHRTEAPELNQHETAPLGHHEAPEEPLLQPLLATNVDTIFSGFPPSFTDMLTQFSCKTEKDAEPYPVTATDHALQEVSVLDTSHNVAIATTSANEIDVSKETRDIVTRIKTYMADGGFHDMLSKIEKVIDELGGDLSL